jgi:fructose-bisphosphate aldolase class II
MIAQAMQLPGGGISKVNIATDLEVAMLNALDLAERITDAECRALPPDQLAQAQAAVEETVTEKIIHFVRSAGHAATTSGRHD